MLFGITFAENRMKMKDLGRRGLGVEEDVSRPLAPPLSSVVVCLQCEMLPAVIIWTSCHSVNPVTVTAERKTNTVEPLLDDQLVGHSIV